MPNYECEDCKMTGKIYGTFQTTERNQLGLPGQVWEEDCKYCHGRGYIKLGKEIK